MSILIKGMEMPTSCRACPLATRFFDGEDVCSMLGTYAHDRDREDDCPLVPVPLHGRLIDGDVAEVIHFTEEDADGKDFYDGILYAADFISKQPTIVQAEEGET